MRLTVITQLAAGALLGSALVLLSGCNQPGTGIKHANYH